VHHKAKSPLGEGMAAIVFRLLTGVQQAKCLSALCCVLDGDFTTSALIHVGHIIQTRIQAELWKYKELIKITKLRVSQSCLSARTILKYASYWPVNGLNAIIHLKRPELNNAFNFLLLFSLIFVNTTNNFRFFCIYQVFIVGMFRKSIRQRNGTSLGQNSYEEHFGIIPGCHAYVPPVAKMIK
jgi:hypothetical protein